MLLARKLVTEQQVQEQKEKLAGIVQMLIGLLKKFSERAGVLREDEGIYVTEHRNDLVPHRNYEHEHDQEYE
jgi:hypothetical protein